MSEGTAQAHRRAAGDRSARVAVVTVSDTRTEETDEGGRRLVEGFESAGHTVVSRAIVPDEPVEIDRHLKGLLAEGEAEVVVTTGGTGIARRDRTIEVVERLLDRKLDGFGELFRMLSWRQVGSAAMLSRATAGLAGEVFVFALPGSPKAVTLALEELILPELGHLLWERGKLAHSRE